MKVMRSKKNPSRAGGAEGNYVSEMEHSLLWAIARQTREAMELQSHGHTPDWPALWERLEKLEDEFEDPAKDGWWN